MRIRLKLQGKIILITIGLLFLAMSVTAAISVVRFRNDFLEVITSRSETQGRDLRSEIKWFMSLGLGLDQMSGMDEILKEFVDENEDVAYFAIIDLKGKFLYHSNPALGGKESPVPISPITRTPKTALYRGNDGVGYYGTIVPLYDTDDENIGAISLGFRAEIVDSKLIGLVTNTIIVMVISFALASTLLVLFISRGITNPIKRLMKGSEEIGGGNYDYVLEESSDDEIGYLSESFNRMALNLKKSQESFVTKVAELEEAEFALREAEKKYHSIFENAVEGIFQTTPDGRYVTVNPALARMYSYPTPEELMASVTNIENQLYVDPKRRTDFRRGLEENGEIRDFEAQSYRKDGSVIWTSRSARAVHDEEGNLLYYEGFVEDITARKRAEEELRKLSRAVEQSPNMVIIADTHGDIEYVNPKFTQITGYIPQEVMGKNLNIFKSAETPPEEYIRLWDTVTSGGEWRGEYHNRKKNGELYWEETSISPIRDPEGVITHFLEVKEDITEGKNLRERLARSERLSAIGQLAANIAHEIRNPLSAIATGIDLLEGRVKGDNVNLFKGIREEIRRLQGIVTDFLQFARPYQPERGVSNLDLVLEEIISLLENDSEFSEITFEKDLDKGIPKFPFDRDQIRQVVWNIALNGLQAMPHGGRLRIRSLNRGELAKIEVSDSGKGIKDGDLNNIFEPFHTTKSGGTGLGLSIAAKIIQAHNGSIDVESVVDRGTVVTLSLPIKEGSEDKDA